MKILLLWDFYPEALQSFYAAHPPAGLGHAEQSRLLAEECFFGWPHLLVPHLRALGHDARLIVGNSGPLREAWAAEHGLPRDTAPLEIVRRQVGAFDPDILWVGGVARYLSPFLKEAVSDRCVVVAWIAYNAPPTLDLSRVDAVLTSHPVFVEYYGSRGIPTERLLPCFEPRILDRVGDRTPVHGATFTGSITTDFLQRARTLSYLSRRTPLSVYGNVAGWPLRFWDLEPLRRRYRLHSTLRGIRVRPPVFDLEMFRLLRSSKVTFNIHIDVAKGYAGNIRMFEATGCGSLLLTEDAPNIRELFEPDREIVTYGSDAEAAEKIDHYVSKDREREAIAKAGQERTLARHTTGIRAEEFLSIVRAFRRRGRP